MRRIWAHIIIVITAFVLAFVSFVSITNSFNVGLEYAGGKTLTFQLHEKTVLKEGESSVKISTYESDYNSAEDVAEKMSARLNDANIDKYNIDVMGNDIVKVTVSQPDVDYTQIGQYLIFNGELSLYSYAEGVDHFASSDVFLNKSKPAYIVGTKTVFPTINIPIDVNNSEYKDVLTAAVNSDLIETKAPSSDDADDGEYARFMYLVYDFIPGIDSFESEDFESKVALKFELNEDTEDPISYYEEADGSYSLTTIINISNDEGEIDEAMIADSWARGTFFVNLLNAGSYDYELCLINSENAPAQVESLFNLATNQTVFTSSTFIAFACALVIVTLILVIFFKLGALSVTTTTFLSIFAGIGFLAIFGSEFNLMALVGFILLGFASLTSGIIYLNKFKDEAYRGRSMKKANTEASKKSNLPITDVNFVLIILGALNYLLGGSIMKSFALITVLGGIVSLILNLTLFKGFMWLDTNAAAVQGKYHVFGIDEAKVPNLINEEKQTYFGAYAKKDFTKHSKVFGIGTAIAACVCIASMLCFGLIKGSIYNNNVKESETQIYVTLDTEEYANLYTYGDKIRSVLNSVKLNENGSEVLGDEKYTTNPTLTEYHALEYLPGEGTYHQHSYAAFIVTLNEKIDGDVYYNGKKVDLYKLFDSSDETVSIQDFDDAFKYEIVTSKRVSTDQPNAVKVIIATAASIGVIALYLLARYKLSRGLSAFITATISAAIIGGLFSLLQFIPIGNYGIVGVIVGAYLSFVFSILFANKEREMVLDDKKHDNSVENREIIMKNAISFGYGDSLNIAIVGLYLGINFFGFGPRAFSWISILILLSVILAFVLANYVLGPLSHAFFKSLSKKSKEKPHKVRKNKEVKKSAEPEEAIFIGIND